MPKYQGTIEIEIDEPINCGSCQTCFPFEVYQKDGWGCVFIDDRSFEIAKDVTDYHYNNTLHPDCLLRKVDDE